MTYNTTPGHIADAETKYFISDILTITGDTRFLVIPTTTTGTTVADVSKNAHNFTSTADVSGWINHQNRGVAYDLNGSTDLMYQLDHADFSFGTGLADSAFSVFALIYGDVFNADQYIISKQDVEGVGADVLEWHFHLTNGKPYFMLHDLSVPALIARYYDTALTAGVWYFLCGTYDGSSAVGGLKIYSNGIRVDDTDSTANIYVAMEDTTAGLSVGALLNTSPAGMAFFNGQMAVAGICAKELSSDEVWSLNNLVRGYFGL